MFLPYFIMEVNVELRKYLSPLFQILLRLSDPGIGGGFDEHVL